MLDWEEIAVSYTHPTALAILKALAEAGEEMSPTSLLPIVREDLPDVTLGTIAYHFRELAKRGLIRELRSEPRRGALEHFYGLSELALTVA